MTTPSSARESNSSGSHTNDSTSHKQSWRVLAAAPFAWPMVGLLAIVPLADVAAPVDAHAGGFLQETAPRNTDRQEYVVPAKRQDVQGEGLDAIEAELSNAQLEVSEAIQNEEAAARILKRARHRNYPRGAALEQLRTDSAETRKERSTAEQGFRATLQQARQAGVPNGTLMDYVDYADWLDQQQS
jgi:hypothetical protein